MGETRGLGRTSGTGKSGKKAKRRRFAPTAALAVALGFGAFAAFAQSEAPREWRHFSGKIVATGTLDVEKTVEAFPSGASKPNVVWFRQSDGKAFSYKYALLSADDKKAVDAALDLDVDLANDANSASGGGSANDENPASGGGSANDANSASGGGSANGANSASGGGSANGENPASGGGSANGENPASGGGSRNMRPEAKCVRRAVLVGVDDYARFSDIRFAGADVELMRSRLLELGFAPENIVALTTQAGRENERFAPNKKNIERELNRVLTDAAPDDMIFVMFTGHGFQTEKYGGYAPCVGFAPSDATPSASTVVDFASTVSLSKLFEELKRSEARFKWALVDACRENLGAEDSPSASGPSGTRSAVSKAAARSKALRKLEAPPGVAILQSCAEGEFSWESDGHGVFTRTFAESLTEVGDANEDGVVTFLEAAERTMAEVKRETSNRTLYAATQTPYLSGDMTRFVLADVKTAEAKERWRAAVEAREAGDYATALAEIDAALALMPNKPEYATEKRTIEAFAKMKREADEAERERRQASTSSGERSDERAAGTLKTLRIKDVEYRFRYCPAGTFATGEGESARKATLTKGFWTLETETTVGMYRSFVEATGRDEGNRLADTWENPGFSADFRQTDAHPATQVDWTDAVAFCEWLARESGLPIRLPTETEWEYACRAGTTTAFSFGSNVEVLTERGNVADASARRKFPHLATVAGDDGYLFTAPVGRFEPNAWGLRDMHGNVCEWCGAASQEEAKSTEARESRVLRGGGWLDAAKNCRSAARRVRHLNYRGRDVGFRVVLEESDDAPETD